jgi:HEAT repeat protein
MTKPAYVRGAAADALGRTQSPFAMKPLFGAARQPEPEVRQLVMVAMVRLGQADATPVLVTGLQDPAPAVRVTAMKLLIDWRLGDLTKLLDPVLSVNDVNARRRAAIVLAYQQSATAHELVSATIRGVSAEVKPSVDIVTILTEAVSDLREDSEVRLYAVHSLGYLGDERALPVLGQLLTPTDPLASYAARSMAMIGRTVNESKVKVTEEVIVRRHPPSAAGDTLIKLLLTATDPKLRMDAAVALSLMGDDPVFGLIDQFPTANDEMKLWVAAVLGAIGKPASDACLDERGSNKNPVIKNWTVISLALVGQADAQALELLKHLPTEEQPDPAPIAAGQKVLEQLRAARAETE